jgi:hypothetical protein
MINFKKPETILIISIIIVGSIIIYNLVISIPTRNYSLDVDAIKDPESLFLNSRVILKNTGLLPLNDINIIYDNNLKFNEKVTILKPGETIILSPPAGTVLKNLQVSSKEGIDLNRDFRSPTKLPGMIGS